jgi:CelD/BcsL family acetyltransferase involved in cellulose biosynthesis
VARPECPDPSVPVHIHPTPPAFAALRNDWDRLAVRTPSPFLTHEWLSAWWRSFGRGRLCAVTLRDPSGALLAGALLHRRAPGGIAAAANVYSDDWDGVAADDEQRRELWRAVAGLSAPVLTLTHLRETGPSARAAREALTRAGWRVHVAAGPESPYLELPDSFDALLGSRSRNLRSQLGRRQRALERRGRLAFRTTTGGPGLERDLDAFVRVEASGWKTRERSAIASNPRTERLYREFARAAAERGWLRLHLLELDGVAVAADLNFVIGSSAFLVKTGFEESYADASPGLVLRGEVLRASIEEGLRDYDFLGGPDGYKLRWTSTIRRRVTVRGFRGAAGVPPEAYRRALRPALKRRRDKLRARIERIRG